LYRNSCEVLIQHDFLFHYLKWVLFVIENNSS
jgi:hypothetical protein